MKYGCKKAILAILFLATAAALVRCGGDKSVKYYNLGLDAAKREDYGEAIRLWQESLRYRPDDPETRYNLGLALLSVKRYQEAEQQLREAVALDPLDYQAQQLLGKSLEEQGELAEAKLSYQASLNIKPSYVPAFIGLASVALKEGQNRSAEDYATRAVEFDPNNVEANLLLSEAYFTNGDFNAAYGQLLSVRRLAPADPDLLVLFGKVTYARHMYEDAIESLNAARSLGVSSDEVFLYLGLASLGSGDVPEAEKDFRLALFKNEADGRAWKGLAEVYIKQKKTREAAEAIAKAKTLLPDDPDVALDDAIITLNGGNPLEAARELERLQQRPDAPQITDYYLGYAYLRMGKNVEAREAFLRFINVWQGSAQLADEAKAIVERLGP
jgi:tetratricopeptide (TPR) repeat protein